MGPRVSVIIPVYNAERFIRETVESALTQTYEDLEIIVVDDGSTDKSAEIIKNFHDERIIYVYQENQGVSAARNRGISLAKGEYIAFLDSDDVWLPIKLEKQVPILDRNPEVGLVYSDCYYIDAYGRTLTRIPKRFRPIKGKAFSRLFLFNFIPWFTVAVRKTVFEKAGLFNPKLSNAADYDFTLRVARLFQIDYVDIPLGKYRFHQNNMSRDSILQSKEKLQVIIQNLETCSEVERISRMKTHYRVSEIYFSLGRGYQYERRFTASRKAFLSSIGYSLFNIKSYIGYLSSLLGIVIPNRQETVNTFLP